MAIRSAVSPTCPQPRGSSLIERLKNESGYSLVEVMVAIMILAIAIIPMVSMFDAGLRAALLGGNYDKARALAGEKMEEVRALNYAEVEARYQPGSVRPCNPPPPPELDFVNSCTVQTTYVAFPNPAARNMMQVTVKVTWDGGNEYTTTGMIAR